MRREQRTMNYTPTPLCFKRIPFLICAPFIQRFFIKYYPTSSLKEDPWI